MHFYSKWPSFTCWFIFHVYFLCGAFASLCCCFFLFLDDVPQIAHRGTYSKMQSTYQISTCGNISKEWWIFNFIHHLQQLCTRHFSTWKFPFMRMTVNYFLSFSTPKNVINIPFQDASLYFSKKKSSHSEWIYSTIKFPLV